LTHPKKIKEYYYSEMYYRKQKQQAFGDSLERLSCAPEAFGLNLFFDMIFLECLPTGENILFWDPSFYTVKYANRRGGKEEFAFLISRYSKKYLLILSHFGAKVSNHGNPLNVYFSLGNIIHSYSFTKTKIVVTINERTTLIDSESGFQEYFRTTKKDEMKTIYSELKDSKDSAGISLQINLDRELVLKKLKISIIFEAVHSSNEFILYKDDFVIGLCF
jgi:hypothetical protein